MFKSVNPDYQSRQSSSVGTSAAEVPHFVVPVPETLKCTVCGEVTTNAKQTNCGHRVCGACVDKRFASGKSKEDCPMVGTEHEYEDCAREGWIKDMIFPDNFAKKQVLKLRVYCSNKFFGCQETPTFAELPAHTSVCSFKPVACVYTPKGCPMLVAPKSREEHERVCKYRSMQCSDCSTELEVCKKNEHAAVCPKRRIACSDCKLTNYLHTDQRHKGKGCIRRIGACIYGCSFIGQTIEMMEKHYDDASAMTQHLLHMNRHCSDTEFKIAEAHEEIAQLKNSNKGLETVCQNNRYNVRGLQKQRHKDKGCIRRIGACIYGCSFIGQTMEMMEKHYDDASAMKQHLQHLHRQCSDAEVELERAYEEISKLKDGIKELELLCQNNEHFVRCLQSVAAGKCVQPEVLREALLQSQDKIMTKDSFDADKANTQRNLQSLTERINSLEQSQGSGSLGSREINGMVQQHDRTLILNDLRLAEYDKRLQALDSLSYDGTLVWKIRDYRRRKLDAVRGRTLSIYSPHFYTSQFGYKSCARIYLNGEGTGKGHHVSLFFVVMKGEYDAILRWPFKQKVTLTLLDQTSAKNHLSHTFRPDPDSSSCQRPTTDTNITSGCHQFVSHELLETDSSYLKKDTIFIRIEVDLEGL